ncbi:MAG: MFS transporter [SAR324 cluster bacterium]|nr:MFS transporter [SAR324 cluster bacterium]
MSDFTPFIAFKVRSFQFQWPADLLASWAFEMETIILGWYILVETESVLLLTAFASLQFMGTLIAPWIGLLGDRLGRRKVFCAIRLIFVVLAALLMSFSFLNLLTPYHVFAIAFLNGLFRPSDLVMRQALIGDTMLAGSLANALGFSRMSMDSARIFGALTGAGIFSILGIGYAYVLVSTIYLLSCLLTAGVSSVHHDVSSDSKLPNSQWKDFKEGLSYIRSNTSIYLLMWLAFLINLTAFPISHGLLPYAAKEIYLIDENGLGHIVAGFGAGALLGSFVIAWAGKRTHSFWFMLVCIMLWYFMLIVFAGMETKASGLAALFFMGLFHSMGIVSMSIILVAQLNNQIRGRVIGVRILAIYGVPLGLLGVGSLIEKIGFQYTVSLYALIGIVLTALIWVKWSSSHTGESY